MPAPKHVLFVCTGNTCRSPMAEALLRNAVADRGDIVTSSAGVAASKGSPASRETRDLLKKRDIKIDGFASRPVTENILNIASHVFAMTEGHLAALEARFPHHSDKFYLLREFSGIPNKRAGIDVPDPIGMGPVAYQEVAVVFDAAIPSIIAFVDSEKGGA